VQKATLLVGAVNVENKPSIKVVERQGRRNINSPPLDSEGNQRDHKRFWPTPEGAYLPIYSWRDTDSTGKDINVVLQCHTKRKNEMPPQLVNLLNNGSITQAPTE
jgi:hypothetical protein